MGLFAFTRSIFFLCLSITFAMVIIVMKQFPFGINVNELRQRANVRLGCFHDCLHLF